MYVTPASSVLGLARDALALALIPTDIPVVAHVHVGDYVSLLSHRVWGRLARRTAGRYEHTIFPSAYSAARADRVIPADQIAVVPYCIRPDVRFTAVEVDAAWMHRRGQEPLVLSLSNALPGKGLHVLAAAARLVRKRARFRLVYAGGWPSEGARLAFEQWLEALGLGAVVRVVGPVDGSRVKELLAEASVLAFPSTYAHESFGLALLEGMGAGCAAVAADHAAARELIRDGVDGRLVRLEGFPSGGAGALADALTDVLSRREQYGRSGAERARTVFNPDLFRRGLVNTVLGHPKRRRGGADSAP